MTAATRNRIRRARSAQVRAAVGFGHGSQNDPKLDSVVWLPTARRPHAPSIFLAETQYEGRLAA